MRQRWLGVLLVLVALPGAAGAQVPAGGEFRVNTYTTATQYAAGVAMGAGGRFVVVWTSDPGQDGDLEGVFGQRYDAAGAPLGGEFRVNSYTTNIQLGSAVATDAAGAFVVVYTTNGQYSPSVAMDPHGNFVVAWSGDGQDGNLDGVFAQRYGGLLPGAWTPAATASWSPESQRRWRLPGGTSTGGR